jgi:hypothetical protein
MPHFSSSTPTPPASIPETTANAASHYRPPRRRTRLTPLSGYPPRTHHQRRRHPYGFRLRCKIRYWLEYAKGKGFRLCSQTTNAKVPGERWNTPKKSTYCMLGIMGLAEQGHVIWTGCNIYEFDKLADFEKLYGAAFDETQRAVSTAAKAAYDRYQARKAQANAPADTQAGG